MPFDRVCNEEIRESLRTVDIEHIVFFARVYI